MHRMRNSLTLSLAVALPLAALSGCGGSSTERTSMTMPPVTMPPVTTPPVTTPPVTMPPVTMPPVTMPPEDNVSLNWPEWPFEPITARTSLSRSSPPPAHLTSEQIGERITQIGLDEDLSGEEEFVVSEGNHIMTVWPPGGPNAFEGFDPQERDSEIRPVLELNGVVLFQARENIVDVAHNTQGTVGYGGLLGNSWFLATYDTVYHFPADGLYAYPYYYVARGSRIPDANVLDVNAHWRGAMVGIVGDSLDEGEFYDNLQQIHNPAFAHGEALITIRSKLPDLVRENTFNTDITFKNIRNVKTGQHYPNMTWEAYTTHSPTGLGFASLFSGPLGTEFSGYASEGETLTGSIVGSNFDEVVGTFKRESAASTDVRYGSFGATRTLCSTNPCNH